MSRETLFNKIIEKYFDDLEEFNSVFLLELLFNNTRSRTVDPALIYESCQENANVFQDENPYLGAQKIAKDDFLSNSKFKEILITLLRQIRLFVGDEEKFTELLNKSLDNITVRGDVEESNNSVLIVEKGQGVISAPMQYIDHVKALERARFQTLEFITDPGPSSSSLVQSRYSAPVVTQSYTVPTPSHIVFDDDNKALVGCQASSSKLPDVLFEVLDL